jgi:hypothetical protein
MSQVATSGFPRVFCGAFFGGGASAGSKREYLDNPRIQ